MDVTFERGDPRKPRGHALVYFRAHSRPDVLYASYVIVLPIAVDFAKYVPPFLASSLGSMPLGDLSAFALPPVPDEVGSLEELQRLAEMREDDLVNGGTLTSSELPQMMEAVGEVVSFYARAWSDHVSSSAPPGLEDDQMSAVNEVLYGLMSERDKLTELSKLVSKLRFAVEGYDSRSTAEAEEEIQVLGRHLPAHYYIPSLVQAAMASSATGAQLAQLYLDRCYKLSNGDYEGARDVDAKIEALGGGPQVP